ncbi:hypothetical protein [Gramella sp. Hel_I_59]|uniref:hypothetical protein n=1 Tax=Gramella sp. Hel_I_59 TaxID=1249978 RepID=UPI00114E0652|nr:hypothetical protein [Gramella sp. Hel_I_59]
MLKKIFVFITVLTLLSSCNEKFDHLKFEKEVAYEIFPQLMDSIHSDSRIKLPTPPPPPIDDNESPIIDTISWEQFQKDIERQERELYQDSVKLVIAISDSTLILEQNDKNYLLKHFDLDENSLDTTNIDSRYKIKLEKLKADDKIRFKYSSEFPEGSKTWKSDYQFFLNAVVSYGRIQFDKTLSFGVLTTRYTSGPLSGGRYRIFIKKENNRWIIDKIVLTAVA